MRAELFSSSLRLIPKSLSTTNIDIDPLLCCVGVGAIIAYAVGVGIWMKRSEHIKTRPQSKRSRFDEDEGDWRSP